MFGRIRGILVGGLVGAIVMFALLLLTEMIGTGDVLSKPYPSKTTPGTVGYYVGAVSPGIVIGAIIGFFTARKTNVPQTVPRHQKKKQRQLLSSLFLVIGFLGAFFVVKYLVTDFRGKSAFEKNFKKEFEKNSLKRNNFIYLKSYFPKKYEEMLNLSASFAAEHCKINNCSIDKFDEWLPIIANETLNPSISNFLKSNLDHIHTINFNNQALLLDYQIAIHSHVKKNYDVNICKEFSLKGGQALLDAVPAKFLKDKKLRDLNDNMFAIMFKIIHDNQSVSKPRQKASNADYEKIGQGMIALGATSDMLTALGEQNSSAAAVCNGTVKFIEAVKAADEPTRSRVASDLLATMMGAK